MEPADLVPGFAYELFACDHQLPRGCSDQQGRLERFAAERLDPSDRISSALASPGHGVGICANAYCCLALLASTAAQGSAPVQATATDFSRSLQHRTWQQ